MATTLDITLIPKILALVKKYGKSVKLVVKGTNELNIRTGAVDRGDTTEYDAKITPPEDYATEEVDGDITRGTMKCYFPPNQETCPVEPDIGQRLSFDGTSWRIVRRLSIFTGDAVALYELALKQ